jgi:hypothetical protein
MQKVEVKVSNVKYTKKHNKLSLTLSTNIDKKKINLIFMPNED